jgi:hypothetical protein
VPSWSIGFCVAITRAGGVIGRVTPATVPPPTAIATNSAACVRGGFSPELAGRSDGADGTDRDWRSEPRPADWLVQGEPRPECFLGNGCYECQPLHNAGCANGCPVPDCDDLLEPFDPWPKICNPVIFSDGFFDAALPAWLSDHGGEPPGKLGVPGCGRLLFRVQPGITNWMWPDPKHWPSAASEIPLLTEVRLWVPAGEWSMRIMAAAEEVGPHRLPSTNYRACDLHVRPDPVPNLLEVTVSPALTESVQGIDMGPLENVWVRLQSWIAGDKTHCRLLLERAGSVEAAGSVAHDHAGTGPAGVAPTLVVINPPTGPPLAIELDWLRVFRAP